MRTGIDSTTLALQASGAFDAHWLVQVANGSGTLIDVSNRLGGISGTLPSPDAPIGTLHAEFLRDLNDDPATSLAPLIASDFNVLDDGTTFSALLQVGRVVVAKVALTAYGGARPSTFYEVFRGRIRSVGWGGWYGGAVIDCNDQGGALQRTKSEAEYTYAAGTAIETAAQGVLTNNGFATTTLSVPAATGAVLPNVYTPGLQKTTWEQVQALAQSVGFVCWHRYDATSAAKLTFFEPDRDKPTSDFTFAHIYEVNRFDVDEEEIGNVLYDQYTDADGARVLAGPVEDAASIAKYGGIRRSFWISEEEGSPVGDNATATGLLTKILPDLADPDAIAEYKVPLFMFGEVSVDRYTFPADDRHYDSDQTLAPFAISFSHQQGQLPYSTIAVRGKPSGGSGAWKARRAAAGSIVEPEAVYAVALKETGRTATSVTYDGPWGAKVDEVRVFEVLVAQPVTDDEWPDITGTPSQGPLTSRTPITFAVPPQGYARLALVVPIGPNYKPGPVERFQILPTGTEPDVVTGLTALIGDSDGSAKIQVYVADRTASIRYATAVGTDPAWPSDAAVEVGTVVALTGSTTITLPAGTVADGGKIRVRVAAYVDADGTGKDGATDHGPIAGAEDVRRVTTSAVQAIADAAAAGVADGKVTTFYQTGTPTAEAVGDLWIDTDDANKLYRWDGASWVLVRDAGITQAIADAADAQSTADSKIVSFFQTTTPTADGVGDFWVDTDDDNHQYRWNGSAWVSIRDGKIAIAQSAADAAATAASVAQAAADDAQATADGKIQTFYQTGAPATAGVGDLWIDTDDSNKLYRWSGSAWVASDDGRIAQAITDAAGAQATADGKVTTFYQTTAPTAEGVGDLWVDTDDNNKLYRWSGAAWVSARDLASYIPTVKADLTRSGTTATFTLTVQDALLRVSTGPTWSSQSQGGSATTFSATWTSSTGTAGSSATLTRTKTFTVTDGADLAVRYQVTYTDSTGASRVLSDTLTLSNLASVSKTVRLPHTALNPSSSSVGGQFGAASAFPATAATTTDFFGVIILPQGVTVTSFRARLYTATSSDTAETRLYRVGDSGTASDLTGALTPAGTSYQTVSATLSETTGSSPYAWYVRLNGAAASSNAGALWAEFTYTVPSYANTI